MNGAIIDEMTTLSLENKISFAEQLKRLTEMGVERYMVDLVAFKKISYGVDGTVYEAVFNGEKLPVAPVFDAQAVEAAIADSRQGLIDYKTFLRRAMVAGCSRYEVFVTVKKFIYCGRDGGLVIS